MIKYYVNGSISTKFDLFLSDLIQAKKIELMMKRDFKKSDFLVVGENGNDDLYAEVIFEDLSTMQIVPDSFFEVLLRTEYQNR